MKIRVVLEMQPFDAIEFCRWLDTVTYNSTPSSMCSTSREKVFRHVQNLRTALLTAKVVPNEPRRSETHDEERSIRLVDWAKK